MPLPNGDMSWPPPQLADITPRLATWSAWYGGDTAELSRAYGAVETPRPLAQIRPSQYAGGVVGAVARWFWGQPTPAGEQRTKLHVPVAADIATASSDLLFSEVPELTFEDQPDRTRLDEILDGNNWSSLLPETAEVASALGGGYLRVTWDQEVAGYPIITAQHADEAWPEFKYGRLWAVTFWQVLSVQAGGKDVFGNKPDTYLRHLERHEPGRIEHALYEGTADKLGHRIPLTEHPATADITLDDDAGIRTGYDKLTCVYIPNIKPQRLWRQHPLGRNLGRPDIAGVEHLMDALDETYTSWMRDIRLGKGRLVVPNTYLESNGPGQGAEFNADREIYSALNIPPAEGSTSADITVQQFEIRTEQHAATARNLLDQILRGAGYSPDTFGLGDSTAMTATEVDAKGRKSALTREKKTRYWDNAIADIIEAVTAVDQSRFGQGERLRPTVEFPASVQPSQRELAETGDMLRRAQAASTDTLVRMIHPDWDDDAVAEEVAAIQAETGSAVPEVGAAPDPDGAAAFGLGMSEPETDPVAGPFGQES